MKPILYKKPMILAKKRMIKTATRRPIKLPEWSTQDWSDFEISPDGKPQVICEETGCMATIPCPKGEPGDQLWTREGYIIKGMSNVLGTNDIVGCYTADKKPFYIELTDSEHKKLCNRKHPYRKTSGRFMYKSLHRFVDEIIEVYPQKILQMNRTEALNEGIYYDNDRGMYVAGPDGFCADPHPLTSFFKLWDSMYEGTEFAVEHNPWMWAIRQRPIVVDGRKMKSPKKAVAQ